MTSNADKMGENCANCIYASVLLGKNGFKYRICGRPRQYGSTPIDNKVPHCAEERKSNGLCGPSGKYFKDSKSETA